ncbi:MAG: DUF4124 domain-containing protein, partial [Pseudomonadota bacterium]|nr:DUF4124 domain-containing protein [Pseudomonadota bacterium]
MGERIGLWFFLCVLTGAAAAAYGEVYRWVDEHGNVHFGDRPGGREAETVELDERSLNVQAVPDER